MPQELPLKIHTDTNDQLNSLEEVGYAYIPRVLQTKEISELKKAIDKLKPFPESNDMARDPGDKLGLGKNSIHIKSAFNQDISLFNCLDKPGVIELAESALGQDCHIIGLTAWRTGPGRPDQNLHADWCPVPLPEDIASDPRVKIPIFIITAHFYLTDITETSGPTKIIPGSHRAGRAPNEKDISWNNIPEQSVILNAGDCVMFRSDIWHRGSANTSTESRYLVQVHYSNRWIAQRMPPYLNQFKFNKKLLSKATPRQRRLLGDHEIAGNYT